MIGVKYVGLAASSYPVTMLTKEVRSPEVKPCEVDVIVR
jgi:hypothetical protein